MSDELIEFLGLSSAATPLVPDNPILKSSSYNPGSSTTVKFLHWVTRPSEYKYS